MNNNDWYNSGSDWYEGSEPAQKEKERKHRTDLTSSRLAGVVVLIALLIVSCVIIFADGGRSTVEIISESGTESADGSGSFANFGDFGDFSDFEGFAEFNPELPQDWKEFFDSYYQPAESVTSDISIPKAKLKASQPLELEEPEGEELSLQELYAECSRSIVAIYGYVDGEEGYYWGSGIIFSSDGLILTNTHILEGCDRAVVKLHDNTEYEAELVGADAVSDIAVLKIDAKELDAASFGESDRLAVGDHVAAIGNPLGEEFRATLTDGIISAIERGINYKSHNMMLLQTNAALNEGNSGGALFNMYGQVVGITNMKMMSNYSSIEGIGFAIPSATIQKVVEELMLRGEVRGRPALGITVGAIPEDAAEHYSLPGGLYVSGVQKNSDAYKKGIRTGDIITQVNYEDAVSADQINEIKNKLQVGDIMIFTIWRDGETEEIEVILVDTNDVY